MTDKDLYDRREQTLVKHLILGHYLERFAHIVGTKWPTITYIDCFAGPWNVRSEKLEDSSFAIALNELRKARETLDRRGKPLRLRVLFIEKDRSAFSQLQEFAENVRDAEVRILNRELENSVDDILRFIQGGHDTFPFYFIDPTGWTGFRLDVIRPLLQAKPGEVLINFMTEHIRRHLGHEPSRQGFIDLFGSDQALERVKGLSGIERDEAMVGEFMEAVKIRGGFSHVLSAVVLHPEKERTHFHLIYGTRHPKGIEVFKDAEERAMKTMLQVRTAAQARREQERTGQVSLPFGNLGPPASPYFDELRERYLNLGRNKVLELLESRKRLLYDEAWAVALSRPLVWESDLKAWIQTWQKDGLIVVEGLQGKEKVPRCGKGHTLVAT